MLIPQHYFVLPYLTSKKLGGMHAIPFHLIGRKGTAAQPQEAEEGSSNPLTPPPLTKKKKRRERRKHHHSREGWAPTRKDGKAAPPLKFTCP